MSPEAMLISAVKKSSVPTPAHLKRIKDLEQELRRQAEKAKVRPLWVDTANLKASPLCLVI